MDDVVLDGVNGRYLTLRRRSAPDADKVWSYTASLALPEGRVETEVWDAGSGLAAFFRELAGAWEGFDGPREYASLEGQLRISCRHDGKGTVECRVTLRRPEPPEWSFEAVVELGAGAQLERAARHVEALVEGR